MTRTTIPPSPRTRWALSLAVVGVATALGFVLEDQVSLTSLSMLYLLAVVVAAYRLPWIESASTAVAAVTALNFFFVPPRWTLEVASQEHVISLGALLVVALVISHLAHGLRAETAQARLSETRARQLQTLAQQLAEVERPAQVQQLGQAALAEAYAGPVALHLVAAGPVPEAVTMLPEQARHGLDQCMKLAAVLGPGTGRWPGLAGWYLPVGRAGQVHGAALVQPAEAADPEGLAHAQAITALLGQALSRLQANQSMRQAQDEAQRQQLHNTLLAAISHDLRTPLATLVGAASTLRAQRDRLSPAQADELLDSLVAESGYLATLTENTLQLVRLNTAPQHLHRDWESIEEVVGAALARSRPRDPGRRIGTRIPAGLPLIQADPVLLGQLLLNLLDNALRYTPGPIELAVAADATALRCWVRDRGAGLPPAVQAHLFEPFAGNDRSGPRGAGLGLALCRAIAQAHGGQLEAHPRAGGGTEFCLTLPLTPPPTAEDLP